MSTIHSNVWLNQLEVSNNPSTGRVTLRITGFDSAITCVPTADLKAALGIDELGCGCDEADDNLKAAIRRAEDAEAFGAAAADRAEEAEATIARVRALMDKVVSKGEPAGLRLATGERFGLVSTTDLSNALDPKPAFTLPTEAGAFVSARNEYGDRYEFELWTNGADSRWMDTSGGYSPLDAAALLSDFTDHRVLDRLIGADE